MDRRIGERLIHTHRYVDKEGVNEEAVKTAAMAQAKKAFGADLDESKVNAIVKNAIEKGKDTEEAIAIVKKSFGGDELYRTGQKIVIDQSHEEDYHFNGELKMDPEDFVALINSKYGWAVAEQAKNVIDGEGLHEQNSNALRYIMQFAALRQENELVDAIKKYLSFGKDSITKVKKDSVLDDDAMEIARNVAMMIQKYGNKGLIAFSDCLGMALGEAMGPEGARSARFLGELLRKNF